MLRKRFGGPVRPPRKIVTVICWLATMHYQLATIIIFADFEHVGTRLLPELARRIFS